MHHPRASDRAAAAVEAWLGVPAWSGVLDEFRLRCPDADDIEHIFATLEMAPTWMGGESIPPDVHASLRRPRHRGSRSRDVLGKVLLLEQAADHWWNFRGGIPLGVAGLIETVVHGEPITPRPILSNSPALAPKAASEMLASYVGHLDATGIRRAAADAMRMRRSLVRALARLGPKSQALDLCNSLARREAADLQQPSYQERWEAGKAMFDPPMRERLQRYAEELQLVTATSPPQARYDHAVVLGGGGITPLLRANYLSGFVADGLEIGSIWMLGSSREVAAGSNERRAVALYAPDAADEFALVSAAAERAFAARQPCTRITCGCSTTLASCPVWKRSMLARGVDPDDVAKMPPTFQHTRHRAYGSSSSVAVHALSAATSNPPDRPNTADTFALFATVASPAAGDRILVVTTQVFAPFQTFDALRTLALPLDIDVDVIGYAGPDNDRPDSAEYHLQEALSALRSARRLMLAAIAADSECAFSGEASAPSLVASRDRMLSAFHATEVLPIAFQRGEDRVDTDLVADALRICESECRSATTPSGQASWLLQVGALLETRSLRAAAHAYEEALLLARSAGPTERDCDREGVLDAALRLASIHRRLGEPLEAIKVLADAELEIGTAGLRAYRGACAAERSFATLADAGGEPPGAPTAHADFQSGSAVGFGAAVLGLRLGALGAARAALGDRRSHVSQRYGAAIVDAAAGAYAHAVLGRAAEERLDVELLRGLVETLDVLQGDTGIYDRRAPLAEVIRAIHHWLLDEVADDPDARVDVDLVLQVVMSIKQTGVATFIRQRVGAGDRGDRQMLLADQLADIRRGTLGLSNAPATAQELSARLEACFSGRIAQLATPTPVDAEMVERARAAVRGSHALEFVSARGLRGNEGWYRVWIQPDGRGMLDRLDADALARRVPDIDRLLAHPEPVPHAGWSVLGETLVPADLWALLADVSPERPVDLVVSPFGSLTGVPWSALRDPGQTLSLVDRAVLHVTPSLGVLRRAAGERALRPVALRLVSNRVHAETGVDTTAEAAAWEAIGPDVAALDEAEFRAALERGNPLSLIQVSAHGTGSGLDQHLLLPGRFDALDAFTVSWPSTVVLLSCDLGRPDLNELDMFGLVISCFAGGASEVVSAVNRVVDQPTGTIGAILLRLMHDPANQPRSTAALLRDAQRRYLDGGWRPVAEWALLQCSVAHVVGSDRPAPVALS